jgi:signal transduction histidine kinase
MSTKQLESSTRTHYAENNRTWWIIPKPFDLVSTILYLGVVAELFYNLANCTPYICARMYMGWQSVVLICVCIVILLAIDRIEYWFYGEETPTAMAIGLLIVRICLIEAINWSDHFDISSFLELLLPFLACLYFSRRVGYWFAFFTWVMYMIRHFVTDPFWLGDPMEVHYLFVFTVGAIFSITMARLVSMEKASRRRSELLLSELEVSHRQLKTYAEEVAELATTRERNRLARDIHDTLGHYLTVINVQLEKAIAFRDRKPQEADQSVKDAKHLASEALLDVRRSVGALRSSQDMPSLVSALQELVEHVRSEQCTIDLNVKGSEEGFLKPGILALYRVAQEGLTNVQKHAAASHVQITMNFADQEASLSLSDNGHGFDIALLETRSQENEGRYGLLGLQERLQLIGGGLRIESVVGVGTSLFASVPKEVGTL